MVFKRITISAQQIILRENREKNACVSDTTDAIECIVVLNVLFDNVTSFLVFNSLSIFINYHILAELC